jgi:hypothetical protein
MGRAFNDTQEHFNRLPASAKGVVRDAVWSLSEMSTGMFVPFITNSRWVGSKCNNCRAPPQATSDPYLY